jgi:hypothetical protein
MAVGYETACDAVTGRFANSPLVRITGTAGLPPEHYRFTYFVKGLYVDDAGDVLERDSHFPEVNPIDDRIVTPPAEYVSSSAPVEPVFRAEN